LSGRVSGEGVGQGVGNIRHCIMHDTQTLRQLQLFYYSEASISFCHLSWFCHVLHTWKRRTLLWLARGGIMHNHIKSL